MNSITLACMQSVNINYIFWPIWCLCSLTKEIVIGNNSYCGECKVNKMIHLFTTEQDDTFFGQSISKQEHTVKENSCRSRRNVAGSSKTQHLPNEKQLRCGTWTYVKRFSCFKHYLPSKILNNGKHVI
jgi:hypothetical protein